MKIVCMIRSLQMGGAERQLLALASTLRKAGHQVRVLTYRKGDFFKDAPDGQGLEFILFEKSSDVFSWARSLSAYLRETGCDMLIAYLPGASIKALLVHRLDPFFRLIVSERNFSRRIGMLQKVFLWCSWREADWVVCNNFAQEALIRKDFPLLSAKVSTIANSVDVDFFSPAGGADAPAVRQMPSDGDPLTAGVRRIVVTARVCRRKNVLGLTEAAALLKRRGLRFRIEWWGLVREDAYYNKVKAGIARLGLQADFVLHPATLRVREVYREADLFCLPSFYEGTSNALAEALSCGKPVVCSAVSDNPRYVQDGVNGFLFDPADPVSMADALQKALMADDATLARWGERSRRTALAQLHPERFSREYLELVSRWEK